MKINELSEMTMRGPDLSQQAELFANRNKERWYTHGKHIADIENYKVLQDGIYYSLWNDTTLVAVCSLSNSANEIDDVYVNPEYRGKKIFSMMLWFFKTRLNRSPLMIGQVHSKMMQEVIKGLSRFKKYWYNIRTNEREPFALDTLNNFYSYLNPTPWRLMLENDGEFDWPMFTENKSFITEPYEPYID